jgi:hypothetical protein
MTAKHKHDYINFTDETPIAYWCQLLNCEERDLLHALRIIGHSYEHVNLFLILNRRKKSTPPLV